MAVYKRGGVYWYNFVFDGKRIQESTKQGSKRVAQQMEAARKTQLAKGEVGIEDRKPAPTLKEFAARFTKAIEMRCAEKPRTVEFYRSKLASLLADDKLGSMRIDSIDEAAIEAYAQTRTRRVSRKGRPMSPASVNRELATLRRLLRLAHEWKVISRIPRVRMLRGERARQFVLTPAQEAVYLGACPNLLADAALVMLDTGLRLGELLSLEWPEVRLEPAQGAKFGFVTVLATKAKSRKSRNVPLSERACSVLRKWQPAERGLVFHRVNGSPFPATHLDQQHARVRAILKFPEDFVLHSLRHTFGTRLGEAGADAFTMMRLMGHSSVIVSQRYVHPSPESVELAYERFNAMNLQNVATLSATPI